MDKSKSSDLEIRRMFNAPREDVWKAWTESELLKRWSGPAGYTAPFYDVDLRVGGKNLGCMRAPDGKDYWSTGVYREIDAPRRFVITDRFADEKGNVVPASYYGMEGDFSNAEITVTLEEREGRTEMILQHDGIPEGRMREDMRDGWNSSFDKLAAVVEEDRGSLRVSFPSEREIVMTRDFDASCEAVFSAHVAPDKVTQWWGPRQYTTTVDALDVKPGGFWRFVQKAADGNRHAFHGAFREIVPPERLSYTFEYEGMPGKVLVETMSCSDVEGRARVRSSDRFENAGDRDGMLASGMEEGARESWDRLAELLAREASAGQQPFSG
jgi:uncharacterized protein YndB with AHSA1/START domain